jgi:hypothetical protein
MSANFHQLRAYRRSPDRKEKNKMTKMKTPSAIILAVSITTPLFAQDDLRPTRPRRAHNELSEPFPVAVRTARRVNIDNIGPSERDPSRVGGVDAELRPAGN